MLGLRDATVGDRSLVIMASYEREPETQTKPPLTSFGECSRLHGVPTTLSTRGAPIGVRRGREKPQIRKLQFSRDWKPEIGGF